MNIITNFIFTKIIILILYFCFIIIVTYNSYLVKKLKLKSHKVML